MSTREEEEEEAGWRNSVTAIFPGRRQRKDQFVFRDLEQQH